MNDGVVAFASLVWLKNDNMGRRSGSIAWPTIYNSHLSKPKKTKFEIRLHQIEVIYCVDLRKALPSVG